MTLYFNGLQIQKLKSYDDCVKLLKSLNKQPGIDAVVAGGWVRDKLNGLEPKDIDIFVMDGNQQFVKYTMEREGFFHDTPRYYGNYENCDMRDDVEGVLKYKDYDLDIIFMEQLDIEEVVENFDVSVCQVWAVLEGDDLVMYASKDFMDWKEKGIIYQYTDIPTTEDHLNRVREKYDVELTPKLSGDMEVVKLGVLSE